MVSVAVLTAMSYGFPPGTLSVDIVAQPAWSVALQVRSSNTETLPAEPAPWLATYTVCVSASTATAEGRLADRGCWRCLGAPARVEGVAFAGVDHRDGAGAGRDVGCPDGRVGRQGSAAAIATSGTGCRQPLVVCALQRVASITETSLSTSLAV